MSRGKTDARAAPRLDETVSTLGGLSDGARFGHTMVIASAERLARHAAEAVVVMANERGVLGAAGPFSVRSLVGEAVEREAMAAAPLTIGSAAMTQPGKLEDWGIRALLHAVAATTPGVAPRIDVLQRAIPAALRLADEQRLRSVVILPMSGIANDGAHLDADAVAIALIDGTVAHLRRSVSRLDRIAFMVPLPGQVTPVATAIREARRRLWLSRG